MRQEGKLITIEEQLKFIDSMPYEDLRRLDHILGNRKSAFTRAGIDNERTTERQNAKPEEYASKILEDAYKSGEFENIVLKEISNTQDMENV